MVTGSSIMYMAANDVKSQYSVFQEERKVWLDDLVQQAEGKPSNCPRR